MTLIDFFSLLPLPVLAFTAIVMYRRKEHKSYPVFWAYLMVQLARVAVAVATYHVSYTVFFYSYWTAAASDVIFTLLLLRSIFLAVFRSYSPLTQLRRFGYEAVLLAVWALALFVTYRYNHTPMFPQLIFDAEQAVSFTAVGMFAFVVGSSALLGIRWTPQICGIALGLGLLETVDLAVFAAFSRGHLVSTVTAGWIETISYNCAAAIYAFCFVSKREEVTKPATIKPEWTQWLDNATLLLGDRHGIFGPN